MLKLENNMNKVLYKKEKNVIPTYRFSRLQEQEVQKVRETKIANLLVSDDFGASR